MRNWLVVDKNGRVYSKHFLHFFAVWKMNNLQERADRPLSSVLQLGRIELRVVHKNDLH